VISSAYTAAHIADAGGIVAVVGVVAGIGFLIWPPSHSTQVALGAGPRNIAVAVRFP
jgi:hypothetical protein